MSASLILAAREASLIHAQQRRSSGAAAATEEGAVNTEIHTSERSTTERRIRTIEAQEHVGQYVKMAGWLHRLRRLGAISFLVIRDGYGMFQAVFEDEHELDKLHGLQTESDIEIQGRVVAEAQAPGGLELHDGHVHVITPVTETLPFEINKKVLKPGLDVFLDHAPVGLRHPQKQATFRLFSAVLHGFRAALTDQGFTEIQTPKLVGTATESGANVFAVVYFQQHAYLA